MSISHIGIQLVVSGTLIHNMLRVVPLNFIKGDKILKKKKTKRTNKTYCFLNKFEKSFINLVKMKNMFTAEHFRTLSKLMSIVTIQCKIHVASFAKINWWESTFFSLTTRELFTISRWSNTKQCSPDLMAHSKRENFVSIHRPHMYNYLPYFIVLCMFLHKFVREK